MRERGWLEGAALAGSTVITLALAASACSGDSSQITTISEWCRTYRSVGGVLLPDTPVEDMRRAMDATATMYEYLSKSSVAHEVSNEAATVAIVYRSVSKMLERGESSDKARSALFESDVQDAIHAVASFFDKNCVGY